MRVLFYIFVNVCVDRGAAWLIDGIFSNNLTPWVTLNLEVSDQKKKTVGLLFKIDGGHVTTVFDILHQAKVKKKSTSSNFKNVCIER